MLLLAMYIVFTPHKVEITFPNDFVGIHFYWLMVIICSSKATVWLFPLSLFIALFYILESTFNEIMYDSPRFSCYTRLNDWEIERFIFDDEYHETGLFLGLQKKITFVASSCITCKNLALYFFATHSENKFNF